MRNYKRYYLLCTGDKNEIYFLRNEIFITGAELQRQIEVLHFLFFFFDVYMYIFPVESIGCRTQL